MEGGLIKRNVMMEREVYDQSLKLSSRAGRMQKGKKAAIVIL